MTSSYISDGSSSHTPEADPYSVAVQNLRDPDIHAIQQIDEVPRILETVCRLTGMGFAAIGRIKEDNWICCAVFDEMDFGMKPGAEIDLHSTLCKEMCDLNEPLAIDEVASDANFADHPAPKLFHFQSCITVPIFLKHETLFGSLCAIDVKPAAVNRPEIVETVRLFADLIGSRLDLAQENSLPDAIRPTDG